MEITANHLDIRKRMHDRGICVIIPTYNNDRTLQSVIIDTLNYSNDIIVVNDGSTDSTQEILNNIEGLTIVSYRDNKGKGHALKTAFKKAIELGYSSAITMDADGQHYAKDIQMFLEANEKYPGTLIVGERNLNGVERTAGSNFANKFSNFWFFVQTGCNLKDTQTGFRLYPLKKLCGLNLLTSRYEAELLVMVLASWHGVKIKSIPIDVYYPPKEERVTHFRPIADFTRISLLNTVLCIITIVYSIPLRILRKVIQMLRTLYSLVFYLFFSLFIVTPLAWLYVKVGKMTEKKRMNLHKLIYRLARFIMIHHGIPGTKFSYDIADGVNFDKPHLIICNHQSHLDLMCQLIFTPKIIYLTNDWVWNSPFYGFLIRSAEYLPVSRGIDTLLPQLKDLVERGYNIAVYPEGTRSSDLRIGRFHQGAFFIAEQLSLDIIPMTLYGTGMALPKKGRKLHKANIHVRVGNSFTQEMLSKIGNIAKQASFFRKLTIENYYELKNEIDRNA